MKNIKVYIIDDHQLVIDGIRLMLQDADWVTVCGESNGAYAALSDFANEVPEVVITDISMPELNGLELSKMIKARYPQLKILILSMYDNAHLLNELVRTGVEGYILKSKGKQELMYALQAVSNGERYFTEELKVHLKLQKTDHANMLTTREKEIIKLMARGLSSSQIADALFISENTVETHRRNIYRKTEVHTAIELLNMISSQKLII